MSVIVKNVVKNSPAYKTGIKAGDTLISLNGNEIMDVLDYRFYENDTKIAVAFINARGKTVTKTVKKSEFEELGLEFETYLMDKQRSCKNKCIFCFIDQLPKGMRESLYFKDDDSRLSFLFGNYITLTNITEHEIERIIKMHISPINISVHTTNPELRVRMMKNKNAGAVLSVIERLNDAGIDMNCQLVLCPHINDGAELERTLGDLIKKEHIKCIAAVPVGLTKHRDGLEKLEPYCKDTAAAVLDIIEKYNEKCKENYGEARVFGADEFYLKAEREIPSAKHYGDFLQLENGVGLWSLFKSEVLEALDNCDITPNAREISIATGVAAYPLINELSDRINKKYPSVKIDVYKIQNNFFGPLITVAGLVTGSDIIEQLKDKKLGTHLYIPSAMLRYENDRFLDDVTVEELEKALGVTLVPVNNDGYEFLGKLLGEEN